jgi:hypothetical protein
VVVATARKRCLGDEGQVRRRADLPSRYLGPDSRLNRKLIAEKGSHDKHGAKGILLPGYIDSSPGPLKPPPLPFPVPPQPSISLLNTFPYFNHLLPVLGILSPQ